MLEQTILFTVIPRGISVNTASLPVSVFVAPRLAGARQLGVFTDWLHWTRHLNEDGMELELQCGSRTLTVPIDRRPLHPDLWEELFKEDTLVRSHTFDDYLDRSIISYSMRQSLSALKSIYQEASVTLAFPYEQADFREPGYYTGMVPTGRRGYVSRYRLSKLVEGLEVHWNGNDAPSWRDIVRISKKPEQLAQAQQYLTGPLDSEGLIVSKPNISAKENIARSFAVFHHMPTPKYENPRIDKVLDKENLLDFHQVLSALNSYPKLLRALGLVFDLDLPRDFVPETRLGTIFVSKASAAWQWEVDPKIPQLATSYVHTKLGSQRIFFTAPRLAKDPQTSLLVFGLLYLDPTRFGLAQVDVDGAMHKAIMLAETFIPPAGQNRDKNVQPQQAQHPEVFDPDATLPSLRSGGFSLFADGRALQLLDTLIQSKAFNSAIQSSSEQPPPFFAEDLIRGYRLDVWDSHSNLWHSLHLRKAKYVVGEIPFKPETNIEEGFVQMAATQPAKGAEPDTNDLYLHEAIARWAGWSLSAPMPAKHLTVTDPDDPNNNPKPEDQPITPFKVMAKYEVLPNSLPALRFGVRYRIRARAVDLAGNSLKLEDKLTDELATTFALPYNAEGFTYLRYEPVGAPLLILRDQKAVTESGSALDRIVIRTFNDDLHKDSAAADITAADRHVVPPRTSVEVGERLGMFDDAEGKLKSDASTYQLIVKRDAGEFNKAIIKVAGALPKEYPLESSSRINALPYLPDLLSRGAAIRDLPGTESDTIGKVLPNSGASDHIKYEHISDPNPRPGSVTMISFGGKDDWQETVGFRLTLAEPGPGQENFRPHWDPTMRLLTVYLPKAQTKVVPLSSFMTTDDLKLMGVWQWLREYIERIADNNRPQPQIFLPGADVDRIAHILQRAVEGGHWMLTPPHLVTLVHAVQQPIGRPQFTALSVDHEDVSSDSKQQPLQTAPNRGPTDPNELASLTAWRRRNDTDAYLLGALKVHGASTAKVDLLATWSDPVDDVIPRMPRELQPKPAIVSHAAPVEELPLNSLTEGYLRVSANVDPRPFEGKIRFVGYYDPEHDQIAFVRAGDTRMLIQNHVRFEENAAPRHLFNDTKRHIVTYTAVATSRFREYFPHEWKDEKFIRQSEPIIVDVPASARPLAPDVVYVVPTFGWQRQIETNLKRSVRFGGGLRIYLDRPWFSSGEGELLGVALWSKSNGSLDDDKRNKLKPFITQWGMDPIWQTGDLSGAPDINNFPDAVEQDKDVSLEESSARISKEQPGRINVVGFRPEFDDSRGLWYADLTINTFTQTYMPFVRLALVRYQPHALADAKVSRVVLADFVQLTPDRSAMVISDPHHPLTLRLVVSGIAPRGPRAEILREPGTISVSPRPTQIKVRVQHHDPSIQSDLAWDDVAPDVAQVNTRVDAQSASDPDMVIWDGTVTFSKPPATGEFRLLVEEYEYISAEYTLVDQDGDGDAVAMQPGRLIYAEVFELDDALVSET